ncbi:TonB-dependent receptor [Terriglobus saanensis]|uniref:TonB-dependent receptor plug n=1 Tax=Terriglobus saanensis (strain ATCC BAA-1853 / DSM 23119 / SP1PR4) TaxID=401053 RepID=E8V1T0_TERSS|nr:TonB-dependent receptor [Terriglobus saanensis]ADV82361.1 TonB-dependent receptor plug [Terriglobus saanensis SP1PR4]
MTQPTLKRCAAAFLLFVCAFALPAISGYAQTAATTLSGVVTDAKGGMLADVVVTVTATDSAAAIRTTKTDALGHFTLGGFNTGNYTVEIAGSGFRPNRRTIRIAAGQDQDLSASLVVGDVSQEVNVSGNEVGSIASALAPMDALLDARSARTEITQHFIQNFTSPIADFGEAVQMSPGTFTTNGNGVGLGQSSTYFRGFPDGEYDIDFDGIPFYDTNTPTHHSWAFFPAQFLGGIDFDRSPGTASTIGPAPFGGSIHLLSKNLSPMQNIRGQFSYGSFNTALYDGEYDSGDLLGGHKLNFQIDVHHLQSDGYQTFNHQTRNAGAIKMQYKFSDKTYLTGFSGVIQLDANTPNFAATRCQMFGAGTGYTCTGANAFFAGAGINFLLTDNTDPVNYLDNQYNKYHVPTDFEYVGLHSEFGHNFILDVKPYTYNYDNGEKFSNATPITEAATINGSKTYNGIAIAPCNVPVTKKGVTALPCAVDKYNSYRKYGETSNISQVSRFGIARVGFWYEWATTNRHQTPSDPLNNWANQALSNFNESFWTNSYQPYFEYEFHATRHLNITAGTKFSHYNIATKQYADDGKTIGGLGTNNPNTFITNSGTYSAWLPSIDANYRLRTNWSVYGQVSTGSVVPPSKVFDYAQSATGIPVKTLPKQQRSTTYQTGTVIKLKRVTLDADFYHIRFQNSYSSTLDSSGEPVYFLQPSSITKGFEAESNLYIAHGLSVYLNASVGRATYTGNLNVSCTAPCTAAPISVAAPSGLWVASTPSDTETEGVTYQHKGWDLGLFNKRVGTFYQDNGAYHNQATINPFSVTNMFFNYTIRSGGRFDQTKVRLSFNNLFNQHSITADSITGTAATQNIVASGANYVDPFNTVGQTPIAAGDNISILPARSVMLSITFGLSTKR